MKTIPLVLAIATAIPVFSAGANEYLPDVRASAGTQGMGLEIAQPLVPDYLTLSLQGNYLKFAFNFDDDGTEYRAHTRLFTVGLLLNVHPFANGFRLSAGVYDNQNYLHASNNEPIVEFGVPVASSVDVDASFSQFAPYAGLGWVWGHRFNVSLDGGAMFQGKANTNFVVECSIPGCQAAAAYQEQAVRDEANKYQVYPVLRLGVGF